MAVVIVKTKKMRFYKKDSNSVHQQSPYKFDVTANLYKKLLWKKPQKNSCNP